jgi:hypothetical protein
VVHSLGAGQYLENLLHAAEEAVRKGELIKAHNALTEIISRNLIIN